VLREEVLELQGALVEVVLNHQRVPVEETLEVRKGVLEVDLHLQGAIRVVLMDRTFGPMITADTAEVRIVI